MDRHTALLAALALAIACATGRPQSEATPAAAGGGTPSARLHTLADEMWDTTLAVSPTIGTFLGLPGARHDRMDDNSLETFWIANLRGGWQAQVTLNLNHFGFESADYTGYTVGAAPFSVPHDLYHLPGAAFILNTPNRAVSGSMVVGYSAQSIFPEASEGRQVALTTVAALRPTPALRVEARWVHQRLTRARDGSRFSTANIPRLKLEYQLTRAIFVRYIGQYFAEDQAALLDPRTGQPLLVNGDTARAIVTNDFRNDLLFSYKPTPGTVVFLGYGSSLSEAEAFRFRNLSRTSDGFFLKLSYLFRM